MKLPENPKIGDKFVVGLDSSGNTHHIFEVGQVVALSHDDKTSSPTFVSEDGSQAFVAWERLTPFTPFTPIVDENAITIDVCHQLPQADQLAAIAQAEFDNAKEILENRTHELNQLKAKYNIQ